jgi:hypothetical protein
MNLQISCQVNGQTEYIELGGADKLTLDISFAEIQDITKKNSAYTKEFNVPGTNGNNYIFEYFFDLNQIPLNFIPTQKFEAQLIYNGYVISTGYIRLNTVTTVKEVKTYNITFYNGVGDVAASISDKFLAELDLSYLSHPFTSDVYLESQVDYNLIPLESTTNYSYQNGKTYWGLYNIGYNYTQSLTSITANYQTTSTTSIGIVSGLKTVTLAAVRPFLVGDTIRLTANPSGNFIQGRITEINGTTITFLPNLGLGSGTYANWNVTRQLVDKEEIPDPKTTPIVDFTGRYATGVPGYITFSGTPVRNYYFKPAIQIKELYEQVFIQNGYNVESEFFNTSYFERFYLPLKFLDETVYSRNAVIPCYTYTNTGITISAPNFEYTNPSTGVTCNNFSFTANTTGYTIPQLYTGDYTFRVSADFFYQAPECAVNEIGFLITMIVNGVEYSVGSYYAPCVTTGIGIITYDNIVFDVRIPLPSVNSNITLKLLADFGTITFTNIKQEIIDAPKFILGNFDYSLEFPPDDYKQIDFITSVNKFFNFVVIPHPIKPKTLIVEPIIDYIGKGKLLDWTSKIDWNSPITISPTTNILNGTLNFNFRLDQDYGNQQFNISNNRVFGTYQLQLNQEYKDNNINFDTMFGAETDIALTNSSGADKITVANMATLKSENSNGEVIQKYNPYKILPRILFRGVTLPNENWGVLSGATRQTWWAETFQQDRWLENSRFTTYPFSYSGFSHYLNWNAQDRNNGETMFPEQDMYDIYYSDYIEDIIAPENKIMKAKIYLTPCEIADLEFNEKIIIKNSYWRINKITGYNLTEPSLCDIELIKLTRDYTPHPVLYYDLISCSGGTDYHTSSDLNYNLYAYVGNYVNIFTGATTGYTSIGCYEVQLGQYNGNYTYEHVFIGSGYTSSGVNVYSDCGCSGRTAFNIVQQT